MLEFFRKYQRYFFVFITIVVIASFSFFGTFSTFGDGEKRDEKIVGRAIDGSPIFSYQVHQLARFISTDREDPPQGRGMMPNLLNDGVIRADFLRGGLADLLVSAYFEPLKEGLQSRIEKAKRFRPYVHPDAPFLSAKAIWDRYVPLINSELAEIQSETEATPATFTHLSRLYQQQGVLQPEILRRVLMYQHQQYSWLPIDQRLAQDDLSLFGFHTLGEWFGDEFVNLAAQFILNSAALAEQKGYRVSLEEAKGDLIHNFEKSMENLAAAQIKPDFTYKQHLRMLGFDEMTAAESWQKVLLFRRYFQDVGQAAFIDRLPFQEFSVYASETAVLQKYEWPSPLHFKNFQDLLAFQVYLKAVSRAGKDPLALPVSFLSLEEVEKKNPELVQTDYKIRIAQLSKSQIGLRASLKEVWEWEAQEKNWELLKKEFSFLPKGAAASSQERFQSLEKLDPTQRNQIDAFARDQLVDQNPAWVEEALSNAPKTERKAALSRSVSGESLVRYLQVENRDRFADLIERASTGDGAALSALLCYSDGGNMFFRVESVEKTADKQILTFEQARSVLAEMTDQMLLDEYQKIRSPKFLNPDGLKKAFNEVKDEVGLVVFADLFKAMDKLDKTTFQCNPKTIESAIPFYVACRLAASSLSALEDLKKNPVDPRWVSDPAGEPLHQQFKLERNECTIQRTSKEDSMKEEAFVMMPDQWSPVRVADQGQVIFFYLQEKKQTDAPILDLLSFGKETLAADAKRYLAERLLDVAKDKNAISIPLQGEKE